jgi:hypothetical protein
VAFDRSIVQYLIPEERKNFRANGFTIYFKKEYDKIIQIVKNHSARHDILWSNFGHAGGLIALLSDRATSNAMMLEVKPFERTNPLKAARLLIWFKDPEGHPLPDRDMALQHYGFKPLAETDIAYVDENPEGYLQSRPLKANIPTPYLLAIFLGGGILFLYAYKRA